MNAVKETGGAIIGSTNATWPLASLKVDKERLEINAAFSKVIFKPTDVISIQPYSNFTSKGIKIIHSVSTYNEKVMFWNSKGYQGLINKINSTGFLDNTDSESVNLNSKIKSLQSQGGFPLKNSVAIIYFVLWNGLVGMDFYKFMYSEMEGNPWGWGVKTALGILFATCLLVIVSRSFRKVILKEGRELDDIKTIALFMGLISGMMLIMGILF